ncbi:MAG: 5'-3' exonuclease H3TH domain-containing protein [Candidatus Binatota bacterium]
MAEQPCVYLIDGSSYIFRAFFALPPLSNASGLPTHAIYGFTTMTLKFLKTYRPEYLAVVLDAGRETFRNQIYHEYKSNRPEAPPDLIPQFPYIRKVLEAMDVAVLELQGYEADDLIATSAKYFSARGTPVVIVSGDKDLMQLVADGVKLLDSGKDKWIGLDHVKEKFGVEPEKVVEVMGLMGDSTDNIPGVKGIGEKSAIALIQRYHSLENLFDHLDELETTGLKGVERIRKALVAGKEAAFLSRELATVRTDVPIRVDLEGLRYHGPRRERLHGIFTELEFTNLLKGLDSEGAGKI